MEQVFEDSACRTLEHIRGFKCISDTSPTVGIKGDCWPSYEEVVTRYPLCGASKLNVFVDFVEGKSSLTFGLIFPHERISRILGTQDGEQIRITGKLWAWNSKSKEIYEKPYDSRTNVGASSTVICFCDKKIETGSVLCVYHNLKTNRIHFTIDGKEGTVPCGNSAKDFCYGFVCLRSSSTKSEIQVTLTMAKKQTVDLNPSLPVELAQVVKQEQRKLPSNYLKGVIQAMHKVILPDIKAKQVHQERADEQRAKDPGQSNVGLDKKIQSQGNNPDKLTENQLKIKELEQRNLELEQELEQKNAEFEETMKDQAKKLSSSADQLKENGWKIKELEQRNMELEQKNAEFEETIKLSSSIDQLKGLEENIKRIQNELKHATELDVYEMNTSPRGICLIINNFKFAKHPERLGAKCDEDNLEKLFSELDFQVEIKQNQGKIEILQTAQEFAKRDHSRYAAFVFIIMSHGNEAGIVCADDKVVTAKDLMCEFSASSCQTLQRKPKLFFIQACRGQNSDQGASADDNCISDDLTIGCFSDSTLADGDFPKEADFLLAFSTVPGYKSYRSQIVGSWFICVLVDVFRRLYRHHHLLDMLTEVNKQVANIPNENPGAGLPFQVPSPTHTLRAQVFL